MLGELAGHWKELKEIVSAGPRMFGGAIHDARVEPQFVWSTESVRSGQRIAILPGCRVWWFATHYLADSSSLRHFSCILRFSRKRPRITHAFGYYV